MRNHQFSNLWFLRAVTTLCCSFLLLSCASFGHKLKSMMGGNDNKDTAAAAPTNNDTPAKFSEQENFGRSPSRKYQRMTKDRFEEDSQVQSNAGSLWVMEGQNSYLFAANNTRLVGDILTVKLEGSPRQQLQSKVRIITKLLEKLERPAPSIRGPAGAAVAGAPAPGADAAAAATPPGGVPPAAGAAAGAPGAPGAPGTPAGDEKPTIDAKFDVQNVPTRIVSVEKDGMYRVKGLQPFMIGKREYKVIVTGLVRPEDFNDDGINASKLLDPQFDIVSNKKGLSL